ncbi:hypothetical protein B566_EDAN006073 [Ephemera danica]|nr:hypothetical protein B566_EDAN006073 [Ephemera danica]
MCKIRTVEHNHDADETEKEVCDLKNVIRQRVVTEENTPVKEIFNQEVSKVRPGIAAQLSYKSMESALYRLRRTIEPRIPNSLADFAECMLDEQWMHKFGMRESRPEARFYRHTTGSETYTNSYFASSDMLRLLLLADNIYVDATFKCTSNQPQILQLLIVHVVYMDKNFPIIYVLMTSKTYEAYLAAFNFIKVELLPQGCNIKEIMCDFEAALRKALRVVFPAARIAGCWFHYSQSLWRRILRLGLVGLMSKSSVEWRAVRMCMALPLLPPSDMRKGLQVIITYVHSHDIFNLDEFLDYVYRIWICRIGPDSVSVFNRARRTNNGPERTEEARDDISSNLHAAQYRKPRQQK